MLWRGSRFSLSGGTVPTDVQVIFGSDLLAHYDAGAGASTDGSRWADQSGNGHDLTASGGQRPTYQASGQNGRPYLDFNGTAHTMQTGATIPIANNTRHQVYVYGSFDDVTFASDQYMWGIYLSDDTEVTVHWGDAGNNQWGHAWKPWTGGTETVYRDCDAILRLHEMGHGSVLGDTSSTRLRTDAFARGNSIFNNNPGAGDGSCRLMIGATNPTTPTSFWDGQIYEIIVVSGEPSAAQRTSIQTYFADKYEMPQLKLFDISSKIDLIWHANYGITQATGVSAWQNLQGFRAGKADLANATSTEQPVLGSGTGPNGTDELQFDGIDDYLFAADGVNYNTSRCAVWAVGNYDDLTTAARQSMFVLGNAGGTQAVLFELLDTDDDYRSIIRVNDTNDVVSGLTNSTNSECYLINLNSVTNYVEINGSQTAFSDASTLTRDTSHPQVGGNGLFGDFFADVNFSFVAIMATGTADMTAAEKAAIEAYITSEFGITFS